MFIFHIQIVPYPLPGNEGLVMAPMIESVASVDSSGSDSGIYYRINNLLTKKSF